MTERIHVCCFSDGKTYRICVGARTFLFDWSDRFGPTLVDKDGRQLSAALPRRFVIAASLWAVQGKRVEDGMCVWHTPRKPVFKIQNGMMVIIEDGEKGWDW